MCCGNERVNKNLSTRDKIILDVILFVNVLMCVELYMLLFLDQVHLFDIDVPGKIRFKESETLSPGSKLTNFDTRMYFACLH